MSWWVGAIAIMAIIVVLPWALYAFGWYYRWCEKQQRTIERTFLEKPCNGREVGSE